MPFIGKQPAEAALVTGDLGDDIVTLAKMAAGTDGQIITYDASGNPAAVGPGSDGQVLTSTGAGSPPAFEAASSAGWEFVGQSDGAATALVSFENMTTGYDYLYTITNAVPVSDNQKFNWKMFRFTLFLWKRVEEDRNGNLWSKTDTAKAVVESKKYKDLYNAFNNPSKFNPKKEAFNLFKLVTDPRQRPYFKTRYFMYEGKKLGQKAHIPQDHIDYLMQFPKGP